MGGEECMSSFNYCVFVGRVGVDPQLRETNEGVSYCRFRLAVDQGKEEPLWLSVVAWRTLATQVEKYVKKGSLVLVSGRLSVDTYTDKQNQKQTGVEIVALDVRFLDQKPKTGTEAQVKEPSADTATDGQAA
jgi:single-strand DNA-binding protein